MTLPRSRSDIHHMIIILVLLISTILIMFLGTLLPITKEGFVEEGNHISVTHSQPSHRIFVIDASEHGPFVNKTAKGVFSELEAQGVTSMPYASSFEIEDSIKQLSTKRGYKHESSSLIFVKDLMTLGTSDMLVSAMPQDANDAMLLLVGPNGSPPTLKEMGGASSTVRVVCMGEAAAAAMKIVSTIASYKSLKIDISVNNDDVTNDLEKASNLANSSGSLVALWGSGFGSASSASVRCVSYATTDDSDSVQALSELWMVMPVDVVNIIPGSIIGKGGKDRVLYVLSCASGLFMHPSNTTSTTEFEVALLKALTSKLWEIDTDALALTNFMLKSSSTLKLVPELEKTLVEANEKIGFAQNLE